MEYVIPLLGGFVGYFVGFKTGKWADRKIWSLKERTIWRVRFVRFWQWSINFLVVAAFTIIAHTLLLLF